ncbi:MAG TPA: hypothetical protein VGL61_25955 [Kofleriaceae bacterium]|jgi:hypothetical protein
MDDAGIPALQDAIRHMHGCESNWIESVPVIESVTIDGGTSTVWEGEVQVFELLGHSKAKRGYAWSHETSAGKRKFYAVLGLGPVVDAATAVRASIAAPRD